MVQHRWRLLLALLWRHARPATPLPHELGPDPMCQSWVETRQPWEVTRRLSYGFVSPHRPTDIRDDDPLAPPELERAWYHRGDPARLDAFLRLLGGGFVPSPAWPTLRAAVIGASMTYGRNVASADAANGSTAAARPQTWAVKLEEWAGRAYQACRCA